MKTAPLTIVIKLANDAEVQTRTLYSQAAVWVKADGELCTIESKDLLQL